MDEIEIRRKFEEESSIYSSWGIFVRDYIVRKLEESELNPRDFLKIYPVEPRVKDVESFIDKIYRKNYTDPFVEITDKVGVRFVVLTKTDIPILKKIVENWEDIDSITPDYDYGELIKTNPEYFSYESIHYVVRNKIELNLKGVRVPQSTPCEIQIRTILQHAYAEVSHNEIYKRENEISSEIKRKMALSMALIEATERLFVEVHDDTNKWEKDYTTLMEKLSHCIDSSDNKNNLYITNMMLYSAYAEMITDLHITGETVHKFMGEYPFLISKIKEGKERSPLYNQPIICLLYYLIALDHDATRERWPLSMRELEPLYTDVGISFSKD